MRSIILSELKHSPFSLVTFAYQAGLRSQGIPGWNLLITAHQRQQISSLDLVQKAVEVDNGLYLYYSKQPESKVVPIIDKLWTKLSYLANRILMDSRLGLFFRRSYQRNEIPGSCTQPINSINLIPHNNRNLSRTGRPSIGSFLH